MSKASSPNKPSSQSPAPNTSAWSRGPPPAVSNPSSNVNSTASTPPPPPNGASANEPTGSTPVAIGGGNSRKGSLMVGGNGDVMPRGNLAFGTVDSPNPLLSSSPAAPSTTGGHLADAVKSFGSLDAETNAAAGASMIRPPRRTSGGANAATPSQKKQLDPHNIHSFFVGKPQHGSTPGTPMSPSQVPAGGPQDRRQSGGPFPGANGMPPYQQMPGMPTQPHLRPMPGMPGGGQRSPVMGGAPQPQFPPQQGGQPGYRPSQPQMAGNPAVRPNGPIMGRPPMGQVPYGLAPGAPYNMMYGQPGYYVGRQWGAGDSSQYNPYGGDGYGWQGNPQHAPSMPLSPRQQQAQLGSPVPPNATLPPSGGGSPLPTPPSRPQSLVGGHQSGSPMPSTPSRPLQPAAPFTPSTPSSAGAQAAASLSAGAAAFTPRAKSTIKISRPDGTSVNLAEEAAAAKGPTPSSTSGVATPEQSAEEPPKPQKKVPGLPVVVRLESEEQKRHRLEEEARIAKMKEQEKREEAERKERQERRAKEEAESKAKAEVEAKTKAEEEETKAKEAAEAKAKEEAENKAQAEAEAKAKQETEAKAKEEPKAEEEPKTEEELKAEEPATETKVERPETPKSTDSATEEPATATPTGDKADELRRSLLTPTTQSAAPSPLASPALAAAGLPAKPVSAIGGTAPRRPTPSLDSKSPAPNAKPPTSGPSALSTAKAIDDLSAVTYPTTVKPQSAELNANSEPGKFRYERDFLMQFMKICKEKPDSLPPLEEIGLEADSSSGFGSTRRPPRTSGGPSGRTMGGMGLMGSGRSPSAMGAFNLGNMRGSTSEERYMRSIQSGGRMGRTTSQGNNLPPMHGLPSMGHSQSGRGRARDSNRGRPRAAQDSRHSANDPDVTPLVVSANAWVNARSAGSDEKSPAFIERKVKALLNKLTEEKFDSISEQILEWANKSRDETDGMTLKLVIKLVFEKSTDEAHWSAMYAKLCRKLLDKLDPSVTEVIDGKPYTGGSLFRKYLLGRCQSDFESGWKAREEAALAAVAKSDEDKERLAKAKAEETKEDGSSEAPMMSEEYYALQKAKRRGLGLVQLIGELYKLDMLSKSVIRECLVRLLSNVENPDEEDLESTSKLLTTVGRQFEAASPPSMDVVFERLEALAKLDSISSRIRFMIMDVIDLRRNKWRSRKEVVPTTIAQIHQQAARENAEKAQAAQQVRESMSRGGSRSGHSRREGPQPGEWQSVSTGSRPLQRPTDFSNIGRGVSSNLSSGPTFGPSSVFARGKKGGAGGTPPISRQNSSANMFAMLNEADTAAAEPAEPAPQRKKLQLKPRTKPVPGEGDSEGEGELSGEEEEAEAEAETADAKPAMTEEDAKTKIATDLKELWGEKDTGGTRSVDDIVEYYRALPSEHQHLLSEKLAEDVFRIAKFRDAEVVAKGWTAALMAEAVSADDLRKGIAERMVTLDDDAIDFPQAYKSMALLMRSISLSQEEIDALLEKVDVYGQPLITPKMKLDKAFGQLDEEASA